MDVAGAAGDMEDEDVDVAFSFARRSRSVARCEVLFPGAAHASIMSIFESIKFDFEKSESERTCAEKQLDLSWRIIWPLFTSGWSWRSFPGGNIITLRM